MRNGSAGTGSVTTSFRVSLTVTVSPERCSFSWVRFRSPRISEDSFIWSFASTEVDSLVVGAVCGTTGMWDGVNCPVDPACSDEVSFLFSLAEKSLSSHVHSQAWDGRGLRQLKPREPWLNAHGCQVVLPLAFGYGASHLSLWSRLIGKTVIVLELNRKSPRHELVSKEPKDCTIFPDRRQSQLFPDIWLKDCRNGWTL